MLQLFSMSGGINCLSYIFLYLTTDNKNTVLWAVLVFLEVVKEVVTFTMSSPPHTNCNLHHNLLAHEQNFLHLQIKCVVFLPRKTLQQLFVLCKIIKTPYEPWECLKFTCRRWDFCFTSQWANCSLFAVGFSTIL